jgi:hypothetical protein
MQISFVIKNIKNLLPKSNDESKSDMFSLKDDPYILIGFNEIIQNTQLLKIPLTTQSNQIHTISGDLNFDNLNNNIFSCIITSLYVPILKHRQFLEYSRQGKEIVYYLDEVNKGSGREVLLKTKDGDIMCSFDIVIVSLLMDKMNFMQNIMKTWSTTRKKLKFQLREETEYFKQNCRSKASTFSEFGDNMERFDTFTTHAFGGERPTNSFLFFELQQTNEKYWIQSFEYIMMIKKTELGMSNSEDSVILFEKMSVREQLTVYVDLVSAISVNTTYLSDYILKPDGSLKTTDDHSNIEEGSGDCEDHALSILYNVKMFQKCNDQTKTGFTNKALKTIYLLSTLYECGLTLCGLNTSPQKGLTLVCHMAILFLFKPWMLNNLAFGERDMLIPESNLNDIIMYENDVVSRAKLSIDVKSLPIVLFGEGTTFLYPYQTDDYVTTNLDEKDIKTLKLNAISRRSYQSKENQYHLRYILFITNFFIEHTVCPVNIPTLYFTYKRKERGALIKGVISDDLYLQNHQVSSNILLTPQSHLRKLGDSTQLLKLTSLDKFGFTPLFISDKTDTPLGRYEHVIPQVIYNEVPKTFKSYNYIITQYKNYNKLKSNYEQMKTISIKGVKTVKLTNELIICIIWFGK